MKFVTLLRFRCPANVTLSTLVLLYIFYEREGPSHTENDTKNMEQFVEKLVLAIFLGICSQTQKEFEICMVAATEISTK